MALGYIAAVPFGASASLFIVDYLWHVVPLTLMWSILGAVVGAWHWLDGRKRRQSHGPTLPPRR
jgi:hypothetical protein